MELLEALEDYGIDKITTQIYDTGQMPPDIYKSIFIASPKKPYNNIIERALEAQKEVYLCFIDYTKAFDKSTT